MHTSARSASIVSAAALAATIWVASSAAPARGATVAHWRFEPGAFLADSSGNGHTLSSTGATSVADVANASGGAGSALFDGNDIMQTISTLDLSGIQQLRITWHQRVQNTNIGILFEHSPNKNNAPGGFLADVNEVAVGVGFPSLRTFGGNNNDNVNHAVPDAQNPGGVWEQFTMTLDVTGTASASNILTISGSSSDSGLQATDVAPLRNDTFFIGARGEGPSFGFVGNIDELKIESIPEPAALTTVSVGAIALLRRRRDSAA